MSCETGNRLVLEWLFWFQYERNKGRLEKAFKAAARHVNGCDSCMKTMQESAVTDYEVKS